MIKYLINLDRDTARLEFQKVQLNDFLRIAAKTGGEVNRFRWWCAVLRPRVKGELGCAESHKEAWCRFLETNEQCAAIFEDDVRLGVGWEVAIREAETFLRTHPKGVVLLGNHQRFAHGEEANKKTTAFEIHPIKWDHCAEAYVIGREAATMLLKMQTPIRVPIDWWGYYQNKGWIELYRVAPPIATQQKDKFKSNLGLNRYDVSKETSAVKRLWWKTRRIIGVAIDTIMDRKAGW